MSFTAASNRPRSVERHCTVFGRQMRVLLVKNFLVLVRHPAILVFILLYPALLILFLSSASVKKPLLTEKYPTIPLYGFSMVGKKIGYYPKNSRNVASLMEYLLMSHEPPLSNDVLLGFDSEDEIAAYSVANPDSLAAAFSFEVLSPVYNNLSIQYYWRVNRYYTFGDPDPNVDLYYDPFRAERLAQLAIMRYILNTTFSSKLKEIADDSALSTNPLSKAYNLVQSNRVRINNTITYKRFPDFEWYSSTNFTNPILDRGGMILSISSLFLLYYFCYQIVSEKEAKLRQSLHTIGMLDSTYYLSHAVVGFTICICIGLLTSIVGMLSFSEYWLNTPFLVNWYTLTMYHFSILSVSIFLSSFIFKAQSVAFLVFIIILVVTFLGLTQSSPQIIFPENGAFSIFFLIPFLHSVQSIMLMSLRAYTFPYNQLLNAPAKFTVADLVSFTGLCDRSVCGQQAAAYDSGHTVLFHMLITPVLCLCYWVLAAYVDLLLPSAHGSRLKPWAPFTLEFWGCLATPAPPDSHRPNYKMPPVRPEWDEDVIAEQSAVLSPLGSSQYMKISNAPVIIYDLNVMYGGCYKRDNSCATACGRPLKHAVKNLSLSIPRNTIYGLLGPNGAGKSTTLSVLTGTLKPTSGYVTIEGYSIVHQRQKVSQLIGYAPQFDILWPDLTPAEHIKFFCNMRGVNYAEDLEDLERRMKLAEEEGVLYAANASTVYLNDSPKKKGLCTTKVQCKPRRPADPSIADLVMFRLQTVGLQESVDFQVRSLSGGMKRRLTVALSLIGNSHVIFMDEASTGLDPISKRKMWDAIQMAKYERSIVLTTHSMEECEALSNKVGIISDGCLRCNNAPRKLKKRYGIGYRLDIEVHATDVLRVRDEIINVYCPTAVLVSRAGGALTLAVPKGSLGKGLEDMLTKISSEAWILTWSIRQTTMEEIFLTVTNTDTLSL
ncbi:Putative amino acid ABC transporter ATP-binding protein [Giardia duodenalis]|uniref:Putative amino acid ABC transporter ATP-binding protein n=1 Tax=Giardia intestinalis TaxID=5741 RepID=V6TKF4_GIAIN|nr:Putative amino acid ABC transporter ATP-binding protein [Giardia intestinalis]